MKHKELKNIAKKIAMYESIIRNSTDEDEIHNAKNEVIYLTSSLKLIEDIFAVEEEITKILNKKN